MKKVEMYQAIDNSIHNTQEEADRRDLEISQATATLLEEHKKWKERGSLQTLQEFVSYVMTTAKNHRLSNIRLNS
jgi:hypothetical protein